MFYKTSNNDHNLKYNPFKACVVPRPIAWVSSIDEHGVVNLAPYSYFNAVSDIPPVVMFSSSKKKNGDEKDTIKNIEKMGEFVVNIATYELHQQMSLSSSPLNYGVSESNEFGIEMDDSHFVKVPRVKLSPISLECKFLETKLIAIDGVNISSTIIFGHVIGIRIDDNVLHDGKIDTEKLKTIARLGYDEYAVIDHIFKINKH